MAAENGLITFRVPDSTKAALTVLAEVTGEPVGAIVRRVVEEHLKGIDPDTLLQEHIETARRRQKLLEQWKESK